MSRWIEADQIQDLGLGKSVLGRELGFAVDEKLGGMTMSPCLGLILFVDLRITSVHLAYLSPRNEDVCLF